MVSMAADAGFPARMPCSCTTYRASEFRSGLVHVLLQPVGGLLLTLTVRALDRLFSHNLCTIEAAARNRTSLPSDVFQTHLEQPAYPVPIPPDPELLQDMASDGRQQGHISRASCPAERALASAVKYDGAA